MRRCWRREEVQESQGQRVPRFTGPKVPGSQGPRYLKLTFKYELDSKEGPSCCPLKIQIYLNCPGLRSSLEGISLVPTISDRRLLVYYKLSPPLIGLRRISYYEAVYNPGRKNVIFRPSMTIWGRSFLLQIILMGCWTHIKQEPSNHSFALPPNGS